MAVGPRPLPPEPEYGAVTDTLTGTVFSPPARDRWRLLLALSGLLVLIFLVAVGWLFYLGVGVWGDTQEVPWGLAIVNYIWWSGIGNGGVFLSALLLIVNAGWRSAVNRIAETMALLALICGALMPVLHLGRPWMLYYMLPYPNLLEVQPQFRSPLLWDIFSNLTFLGLTAVFWYTGLLPDLATLRDRASTLAVKRIFGVAALGWRGSARGWHRWRRAYVLTGALGMPLAVAMHSGAALLLAVGPQIGWHSTLFPPYFVMGALFSGVAVVILIAAALRTAFRLDGLLTLRHFDLLGQVLLVAGLCTFYAYVIEPFIAWYSGDRGELARVLERWGGTYSPVYWLTVGLNFLTIQALWWRRLRRTLPVTVFCGLAVTVGMFTECYMLVVTGLYHGFSPGMWHRYVPTLWDWLLFLGTLGVFLFLLLLFVRVLSVVSIGQVKATGAADAADSLGGGRP